MARINRFEEIEAWKKARVLVKQVYEMTGRPSFSKDFALKDQLRRAAVSIISNIAEGFSRQTDQEFIQFLFIAKGSVSEVQSQLYVALDLGYVPDGHFSRCYEGADEVARLLSGFIKYLKGDRS